MGRDTTCYLGLHVPNDKLIEEVDQKRIINCKCNVNQNKFCPECGTATKTHVSMFGTDLLFLFSGGIKHHGNNGKLYSVPNCKAVTTSYKYGNT